MDYLNYFFRVKRNGKFESVPFSDMTWEEREQVMKRGDEKSEICLCCIVIETAQNKKKED